MGVGFSGVGFREGVGVSGEGFRQDLFQGGERDFENDRLGMSHGRELRPRAPQRKAHVPE